MYACCTRMYGLGMLCAAKFIVTPCIKNNNSLAKQSQMRADVIGIVCVSVHSHACYMISSCKRKEENDWVVTALFRSFEPDVCLCVDGAASVYMLHLCAPARGFHEYIFGELFAFVCCSIQHFMCKMCRLAYRSPTLHMFWEARAFCRGRPATNGTNGGVSKW